MQKHESRSCCHQTQLLMAFFMMSVSCCALAQEKTAENIDYLPTIVASSKYEQLSSQLNGAVNVTTEEELNDRQVNNVADLGRVFPELSVGYSGTMLYPLITVRGVTSAQDYYNPALTVYVDGVPQLPSAALQSLLDVESIELLKGPQGTLYGKSAEGGILNILTHKPDNDLHALLKGGISSRHSWSTQARLSGPLVKDLLYFSAALTGEKEGGSLTSPILDEKLGGYSTRAGKVQLRLAPIDKPWELNLTGARECLHAQQDVYVSYDALNSSEAYTLPSLPPAYRDVRQYRCFNSFSVTGEYRWDQWKLDAIVSTQRLKLTERQFPFATIYSWQPENWRQNTQELRLSTVNAQDRKWSGVVGVFRQSVKQDRHYVMDGVIPQTVRYLDSHSRNVSETLALYGDVTWKLTPQFDVGSGIRFSHDQAQTDFHMESMGYQWAEQNSKHQNTWLMHLNAGYQVNDALRTYVNFSQGYKPAGYTLSPSSQADGEGFDRERSTSMEVGVRYTTEGLRLGLSTYRIDTKNLQLYGDSERLVGYQTLKNVGDARSVGVELSGEWDVSPQLTLSASGFLNRAKFTQYRASACMNCNGNDVPFTPRYGVTIAVKGHLMLGDVMLRPQVILRRVGPHYFDSANQLRQKSYTLVDASLSIEPNSNVELAFYVKNLTNKKYRTYGYAFGSSNFAQLGQGRTVGATLAWKY